MRERDLSPLGKGLSRQVDGLSRLVGGAGGTRVKYSRMLSKVTVFYQGSSRGMFIYCLALLDGKLTVKKYKI